MVITDALTGDITNREELEQSIEDTQQGINDIQEFTDPFSELPEEEQPTEFAAPPIGRSGAGVLSGLSRSRQLGAVTAAVTGTNAVAGGGVGDGDTSPAETPTDTRAGDTDFGSETDRDSPLQDTPLQGINTALNSIADAIELIIENARASAGIIIGLALIYIVGQLFTVELPVGNE